MRKLKIKRKLKEYARNHYHSVYGKVKSKKYFENNKERLQEQACFG